MNIIVSAGACRASGAKAVYLQFIGHLKRNVRGHKYYVFIDNDMPCQEIDGVEYIKLNVRSGISRLKFDYFGCKNILKRKGINPDIIISFQNTGEACLKEVSHIIYYHQALPFYPNQWNPLKKEERSLAFYKYVYPYFVRNSYKNNNVDFIAQTPFVKRGIVDSFGINPDRVHVLSPDIESFEKNELTYFQFEDDTYNFLYPATPMKYKNHKLLVDSLISLKQSNIVFFNKIRIHLTMTDAEGMKVLPWIKKRGLDSNFVFHGSIPHNTLLSMLACSHGLLFPSTIETIGLPLIEAARLGKPIVVSNLAYAHEALGNYSGGIFVDVNNAHRWADEIKKMCTDIPKKFEEMTSGQCSSWTTFFDLVESRLNGHNNY